MKNRKLRVLGICAGNGVPLFAFQQDSSYGVIGNVEPRAPYHSLKDEQWYVNFPGIPIWKTLQEGLKPDIIIGNPKCGASSIMRYSRSKEMGNPKEEPTIKMFVESIQKYRPKVFLMENLPKLLHFISEEDFISHFTDYDLVFHKCSVSKFGNSQISRVRLIIIGVLKEARRININKFTRVYAVNGLLFTKQLLNKQGLTNKDVSILNVNESRFHKVALYDYRDENKATLTLSQVRKLWRTDFKGENKWPIKSKKMHTLPGIYKNKANGYPLTVRKESRQFKWDGRNHTPRELACIQGIPLNFKLYFEPEKWNYWINKARLTIAQSPPFEVIIWFKQSLENGLNKLEK